MLSFSTIRRWLLVGAGYMLFLSGLSLAVAHTSIVRRFVLVQLQSWSNKTTGLILDARDLEYNLLACRFELQDITLKPPAPGRCRLLSKPNG